MTGYRARWIDEAGRRICPHADSVCAWCTRTVAALWPLVETLYRDRDEAHTTIRALVGEPVHTPQIDRGHAQHDRDGSASSPSA